MYELNHIIPRSFYIQFIYTEVEIFFTNVIINWVTHCYITICNPILLHIFNISLVSENWISTCLPNFVKINNFSKRITLGNII